MTVQKEVQEAKNTLFGTSPTPDDPIIFDVLTKLYVSGQEDGYTQGKDEGCQDCAQQGEDAGYERGYAAGAQDTAEALQ
jgi:flagellar biosynthesis/type III secretory pathway protein FliH